MDKNKCWHWWSLNTIIGSICLRCRWKNSGYIPEKTDDIIDKVLEKNGVDKQIDIIKEECMELAVALQKYSRTRGDSKQKYFDVIDEIADADIVLRYAKKIFPEKEIEKRVQYKLKRLEKRYKNNDL